MQLPTKISTTEKESTEGQIIQDKIVGTVVTDDTSLLKKRAIKLLETDSGDFINIVSHEVGYDVAFRRGVLNITPAYQYLLEYYESSLSGTDKRSPQASEHEKALTVGAVFVTQLQIETQDDPRIQAAALSVLTILSDPDFIKGTVKPDSFKPLDPQEGFSVTTLQTRYPSVVEYRRRMGVLLNAQEDNPINGYSSEEIRDAVVVTGRVLYGEQWEYAQQFSKLTEGIPVKAAHIYGAKPDSRRQAKIIAVALTGETGFLNEHEVKLKEGDAERFVEMVKTDAGIDTAYVRTVSNIETAYSRKLKAVEPGSVPSFEAAQASAGKALFKDVAVECEKYSNSADLLVCSKRVMAMLHEPSFKDGLFDKTVWNTRWDVDTLDLQTVMEQYPDAISYRNAMQTILFKMQQLDFEKPDPSRQRLPIFSQAIDLVGSRIYGNQWEYDKQFRVLLRDSAEKKS